MVKENNKEMFMINFIKTAIFFLLLLVLINCNARKSHTKIEEKKVDSSVVSKQTTTASAKIVENTYEISDLNTNSLNFSIIPNEKDTIVITETVILRDKNGNSLQIPYKSNSRFDFNSQNSQNKQVKQYTKQIDSLLKINALNVAKLKSYEKQKEKQTEKKGTPLHVQILLYLGFFVISVIIWEMFKRNYLSLFQIVKKFLKNIG